MIYIWQACRVLGGEVGALVEWMKTIAVLHNSTMLEDRTCSHQSYHSSEKNQRVVKAIHMDLKSISAVQRRMIVSNPPRPVIESLGCRLTLINTDKK